MMKVLKKLSVIFLAVSIFLASMLPASALSADKTTQEKAQTLNTLKIISGSNGQFNLENKVTRAEAVTFIVKLVGRGNDVTINKDRYKITPFTDVPSSQWYAPFIGFCKTNGFITDTALEFKPLDNITEKDFLRLVLTALDYREGTDFAADSIYDKARELGLITLNDYVGHINSTIVLNRGNVVEILYTALQKDCREGGKLCQKLIDEGVTSRLELMALGLVVDTMALAIQQVKVTGPDSMEIKMNEAVVAASGIRIFQKTNENETLACSVLSITGDTVAISVSGIEINREYTVELTNVIDSEGNRTGRLQKAFTGSVPEEVVSDFFRIRKIEPVNGSSIKVYFTHPVTLNSEVCLYYSVLKDNSVVVDGKLGGIRAGLMNSDKTGVLLTFDTDILSKGSLYSLKIDGGMMSAYGVRLNDGLGDTMKFVAKESAEAQFALNQIAATDKKTVLIGFNKEVNAFLALQIFNFYLTDANNVPIRITSTAVDPTGCFVYLNLAQDMEKGKKYNLVINNLNDITKQEYITEESHSFTADYSSAVKFELGGIGLVDSQTVQVYFNKVLDPVTAAKPENCLIYRSGILMKPDKVLYDPDAKPNMLTLYLSKSNKLSSQYVYEVQLNGMKDNLGNNLDNVKVSFTGTDAAKTDVAINDIKPVSTDAVKITFTREIAFNAPNLLPSNYTLEYAYNRMTIKKAPISVIYADAKTLVLKFDSLEYNTPYKLKAANLMDYSDSLVKGQEKIFQLARN